MKIALLTAGIIVMMAANVTAADTVTVLNVLDLNYDGGTNSTLKIEGSTNGVTVVRSANDNDYIYTVTYTNADYNADAINDTMTFDVRVQGWSGGTITWDTNSAVIGTTDAAVDLSNSGFTVGNNSMNEGQSLEFSLENFNFILSEAGSAVGTSDGFDQVSVYEFGGYGHRAVFGVGNDLQGHTWQNNTAPHRNIIPILDPLHISSTLQAGASAPAAWYVGSVDFGMTITFSPPSATVIMFE